MLWREDFNGLKTGVTSNAGPCLAGSYFHKLEDSEKEIKLVIVILGCLNMDIRWQEMLKLAQWASY